MNNGVIGGIGIVIAVLILIFGLLYISGEHIETELEPVIDDEHGQTYYLEVNSTGNDTFVPMYEENDETTALGIALFVALMVAVVAIVACSMWYMH